MKNSIILILFIAFISTKLAAQSVGLGNTDPSVFSKYRLPETNLSSLWFNTGLNFRSDKRTDAAIGQVFNYGSSSLNSDFTYSLSPKYYLLKQTDEKWLSLNFIINENYGYSYSEQQVQDSTLYHNRNKSNQFNLNLQGSYGRYLSPGDLFYSFVSTISLAIHNNYYDDNQHSQYQEDKLQQYNVSFGIGWGKIRDVTPVVSAIRLQERLKQLNLLNNDLSEKTIEDLSEQFSKTIYYSQVHDRSDKFFWQDIEKTLSNDDVSLSGINQYASSYIKEIPNEIRFTRNEGITTGLNLMINFDNQFYADGYEHYGPDHLYTLGNVYLNLSHQLNLNSQVRFSLSLSGGPNLTKNSDINQEYIINSTMGYDYEITDRIVASVSNTFNYTILNYDILYGSRQSKLLSDNFSLSINYFIEDNLSLNAYYKWDYYNSRANDLIGTSKSAENINNIVVGFTYYVNRGFLYN